MSKANKVIERKVGYKVSSYISTDYYTIYDKYTSQVYLRHVKSYYNTHVMGDQDMHLFDVRYNNLNQIAYVYAADPIIAAIGLIDHGYIIIEHVTKL